MNSHSSHVTSKFTTSIEREGGRYIIELPEQEFEYGTLAEGDVCRVSVEVIESDGTKKGRRSENDLAAAPVSVGDQRTVEIESIGDEGDGIARVERGYVLIVPGTEPGDEVRIEITDITPNVGFAEVIETEDSQNENA